MKQESLRNTLLVALCIIFLCSLLLSITITVLRPMQAAQNAPGHYREILQVAGLINPQTPDKVDPQMFSQIETNLLNLTQSAIVKDDKLGTTDTKPYDYQQHLTDPNATIAISEQLDRALLGRRPVLMPIYWINNKATTATLVLPIYGKGMWSMIHGYIALAQDFNTIYAVSFYQHGETPGIGDQIQNPEWLRQWQGKQLYNAEGHLVFTVGGKVIRNEKESTHFHVDGISGATKTVEGVANIIHYWMGDGGYRRFLDTQTQPQNRSISSGREQ